MDKRQHLVEAAFRLFYQHGIHAVGINTILADTGIAKKTLYNHFPSKDALIEATVLHHDQQFSHWLQARMALQPSGREALVGVFTALDDWFNDRIDDWLPFRGCYFTNACAEYGDGQHPVHLRCQDHKANLQRLFRSQLGQASVLPSKQERLARQLTQLKDGATVAAHVLGDRNAARAARKAAEKLLKGI